MESILTTIKKMLGIPEEYEHFDIDIIAHINMVLMTLNQLGVGPDKPASISSSLDTWYSIFGDINDFEAVKTYIYLKVKIVFDSNSMSSSVLEAINRTINELEWRLTVQSDLRKEG